MWIVLMRVFFFHRSRHQSNNEICLILKLISFKINCSNWFAKMKDQIPDVRCKFTLTDMNPNYLFESVCDMWHFRSKSRMVAQQPFFHSILLLFFHLKNFAYLYNLLSGNHFYPNDIQKKYKNFQWEANFVAVLVFCVRFIRTM